MYWVHTFLSDVLQDRLLSAVLLLSRMAGETGGESVLLLLQILDELNAALPLQCC